MHRITGFKLSINKEALLHKKIVLYLGMAPIRPNHSNILVKPIKPVIKLNMEIVSPNQRINAHQTPIPLMPLTQRDADANGGKGCVTPSLLDIGIMLFTKSFFLIQNRARAHVRTGIRIRLSDIKGLI